MSDGNDDGLGQPTYKVGYAKPPIKHQFKKGKSGNPRGRKPKVRNVSTLLATELDRQMVVLEGGLEKQISKRQALVTSLVNDAIKGKASARQLLLKVLDVAPPPEPFVPNDDDEMALDEMFERMQERRRGDDGDVDEGGLTVGEPE